MYSRFLFWFRGSSRMEGLVKEVPDIAVNNMRRKFIILEKFD